MKIFFKLLFNFITLIANFFLAPINQIVSNVFPEFSELINGFNTFLSTFIGPGLKYFFNILPPFTRTVVLYYLSILLILYTASLLVHVAIKVIEIIKAVKIW